MRMSASVQEAIAKVKNSAEMPITKWQQISGHLLEAGLLYRLQVVPNSFLVRAANRGGMPSWHVVLPAVFWRCFCTSAATGGALRRFRVTWAWPAARLNTASHGRKTLETLR